MIPLRDNNPTATVPIITLLLIALNVYIYFTQPQSSQAQFEMIPANITTGHANVGILHLDPSGHMRFFPTSVDVLAGGRYDQSTDIPVAPTIQPVWLTIFTAMFLHANFLHLAGNMLFLWIFGNNVEDALGRLRFLLFYLGCGVAAAFAQIMVAPYSLIPTLGASGAIAGVLGAYIVLFPGARVLTLFIVGLIFLREVSAGWVIGLWIALQVLEGVSRQGGEATGGVAYFAHIGGFVAGVIAILMLGGRKLGMRQIRAAGYSPRRY